MDLAARLVVHVAGPLRRPVVEAREDREQRTRDQHVVEVRDDVVGVVHDLVDAGIGQHHAGYATKGEHEDEADGPQHRRLELD